MRTSHPAATGPLLVLAAVVSVQFGGALAATLIPVVGPVGSVALRLAISALVLGVIARPALRGRSHRDWQVVLAYGATLAAMNLSFYAALERLPIGVTVTIEFVGPLVLAACLSRSARDVIAVLAAAAGVLLISGAVSTPWSQLDGVGIGLALLAGALWAAYILTSGWTGARFADLDGLAIALCVGAVVLTPIAVALTGSRLWHGEVLLKGLGIAMLSSLVPYSLELIALRRLPARVFGVLLSLEPAAAALAGLLVLGQRLSGLELAGMALVVAASVVIMSHRRGAAATAPAETG
ncbi:EamA family transporter [Calidifontibacter sp. DB0510]|uniref:EamA family transporter n=1 Tax=Metallococcus carri TaxID=1656884 RepID=A0A967AYT9_9MICO|nr:EamA family transporter [Metallococcus carri]NHN54922.1 EamA family transporter [Metallococcus carri]NOP37268.1 EamA family transporter [Calidifontibacter sp. DB2511S]